MKGFEMERRDKAILGAAAIVAVAIFFSPTKESRFAMVSGGGDGMSAYRLDRQTGEISACGGNFCQPVIWGKAAP